MAGPFLRGLGSFIRGIAAPPAAPPAPTPKPTKAVPSARAVAARAPGISTTTIALIVGGAVVAVGILVFALRE